MDLAGNPRSFLLQRCLKRMGQSTQFLTRALELLSPAVDPLLQFVASIEQGLLRAFALDGNCHLMAQRTNQCDLVLLETAASAGAER